MKKLNCDGVGDNNGFFEMQAKTAPTVTSILTLDKALEEVFEEYQSLCLDNEDERYLLRGLIIGTFSRLTREQEKNNESNS